MAATPSMTVTTARAHPRYALEIDASVTFGSDRLPVRTRDVSRGGLCFAAKRAIPLGEVVHISMSLVFDEATFSEPLDLRARVVWCTALGDAHQVGTSFLGLTAEGRAYLDMFLRYLKEGLERHEAELAEARGDHEQEHSDDEDKKFG
jgi:hypothetical protein